MLSLWPCPVHRHYWLKRYGIDVRVALCTWDEQHAAREESLQAVDQDTQKAMMAWYHKRQEQQKHLEENQDDTYLESTWASGSSLKAHFAGVSNVRMPF
jgi:Cilia- and flagella-associated protein 298